MKYKRTLYFVPQAAPHQPRNCTGAPMQQCPLRLRAALFLPHLSILQLQLLEEQLPLRGRGPREVNGQPARGLALGTGRRRARRMCLGGRLGGLLLGCHLDAPVRAAAGGTGFRRFAGAAAASSSAAASAAAAAAHRAR